MEHMAKLASPPWDDLQTERERSLATLVKGWRDIVAWYAAAGRPDLLERDDGTSWTTADYAAARTIAEALVISHPDESRRADHRTALEAVLPVVFPTVDGDHFDRAFDVQGGDWIPGKLHGWLAAWAEPLDADAWQLGNLLPREHALINLQAMDLAAAMLQWQTDGTVAKHGIAALAWDERSAFHRRALAEVGSIVADTSDQGEHLHHEREEKSLGPSWKHDDRVRQLPLLTTALARVPMSVTAHEFKRLRDGLAAYDMDEKWMFFADETARVHLWRSWTGIKAAVLHLRRDVLGYHRLAMVESAAHGNVLSDAVAWNDEVEENPMLRAAALVAPVIGRL